MSLINGAKQQITDGEMRAYKKARTYRFEPNNYRFCTVFTESRKSRKRLNNGLEWYPEMPPKEWLQQWKGESTMLRIEGLNSQVLKWRKSKKGTSYEGKKDPVWLNEFEEFLKFDCWWDERRLTNEYRWRRHFGGVKRRRKIMEDDVRIHAIIDE
jgi:hypothetical protein